MVDEFRLERRCDDCIWESVQSFESATVAYADRVPHDGLWTYRLVALVDGTRIESPPVASGVYVLRVHAPDRVLTRRVAYVK